MIDSARSAGGITTIFVSMFRPVLERRWSDTGVTPLLAAPFHPVVPRDWDLHLP